MQLSADFGQSDNCLDSAPAKVPYPQGNRM